MSSPTLGAGLAPAGLSVLPSIPFGFLAEIPWVGTIVFQQKPIALTAIVLVFVLNFALFRTRWGLRTRAVGEPSSSDDDEHSLQDDEQPTRTHGTPPNVYLRSQVAHFGEA